MQNRLTARQVPFTSIEWLRFCLIAILKENKEEDYSNEIKILEKHHDNTFTFIREWYPHSSREIFKEDILNKVVQSIKSHKKFPEEFAVAVAINKLMESIDKQDYQVTDVTRNTKESDEQDSDQILYTSVQQTDHIAFNVIKCSDDILAVILRKGINYSRSMELSNLLGYLRNTFIPENVDQGRRFIFSSKSDFKLDHPNFRVPDNTFDTTWNMYLVPILTELGERLDIVKRNWFPHLIQDQSKLTTLTLEYNVCMQSSTSGTLDDFEHISFVLLQDGTVEGNLGDTMEQVVLLKDYSCRFTLKSGDIMFLKGPLTISGGPEPASSVFSFVVTASTK